MLARFLPRRAAQFSVSASVSACARPSLRQSKAVVAKVDYPFGRQCHLRATMSRAENERHYKSAGLLLYTRHVTESQVKVQVLLGDEEKRGWHLFGGKAESCDTSSQDTAIREFLEETACMMDHEHVRELEIKVRSPAVACFYHPSGRFVVYIVELDSSMLGLPAAYQKHLDEMKLQQSLQIDSALQKIIDSSISRLSLAESDPNSPPPPNLASRLGSESSAEYRYFRWKRGSHFGKQRRHLLNNHLSTLNMVHTQFPDLVDADLLAHQTAQISLLFRQSFAEAVDLNSVKSKLAWFDLQALDPQHIDQIHSFSRYFTQLLKGGLYDVLWPLAGLPRIRIDPSDNNPTNLALPDSP